MVLRELLLKLGLDVDEAAFAKGQLAAGLVEFGMRKALDAVVELGRSFVEHVQSVAEYGEKIHELAQVTGLGTQSLQGLAKAAALEGVSIDDFAHGMVLLSRTMNAAKSGSDEAEKAFGKIGVRVKDTHGKLRPTEDVFLDIADHFSKMPDGAEKTATALQLLGRSGAEMIPILNQGREELEKFLHARVMSEEDIKAGKEIVVIQRQLGAQTKALWREAIGPLLPAIRDLLRRFLEWKKANAEIMKQTIRKWVGAVIKVVETLGDVLGFLIKNADMLKQIMVPVFIAIALAGSEAALKLALSWAAALAPFIAIGAAIGALLLLIDDYRVYKEGKGRSLIGLWKNTVSEWMKGKGDDPWWLTAIKEFVRLIERAIKEIDEFQAQVSKAFGAGGTKMDKLNAVGDVGPRALRAAGLPQSASAAQADARFQQARAAGSTWWEAAKFAMLPGTESALTGLIPNIPSVPASMTARATPQMFQANISVVQQPNQSGPELAKQIRSEMQSFYDEKMEDAAANYSGGP